MKKFGMMAGAKYGARSITGIYSNVGIFKFPEEYGDYIQYFGFLASTYSMQLCSCSYKDNLVLGFTSKIPGDSIQRNFLKILKEKGMRVNVQNTCPNDIIRALKTRKHKSGGRPRGIRIQEGK